jgi:hypothetical protein
MIFRILTEKHQQRCQLVDMSGTLAPKIVGFGGYFEILGFLQIFRFFRFWGFF